MPAGDPACASASDPMVGRSPSTASSTHSILKSVVQLAAERPGDMLTESEDWSQRRARALAAESAAHAARSNGGAAADAQALDPLAAALAKSADYQRINVGTPSDHFALSMHHFRQGVKLLVTSCFSPSPPPPPTPSPSGRRKSVSVSKPMSAPKGDKPGAAAADDDEEDEEEVMKRIVREAGVIIPTDPWKEKWDVMILVMILYSAIVVPYRICFDAPAAGVVWVFEQLLTAGFIIDVVFNFNTAHSDNNETWCIDRREIACRYLSGWFWIDVPSCVPVELLDLMLEGEQTQMGLLRFLRLFRLIRLLRLLKVSEYVANLEEKFDINLTFLRIATMLIKLVFLSHILACFWFYVAYLQGIDQETKTWVSEYDDGSGLADEPQIQYLYSMYWALTTLTTVGYGDIIPQNNVERFYALFALLIGALVFGYMLSSIGSLVAALDRQAALSEEKMDAIKEYMRWRKFPRELTVRIRRYYEYFYERKTAFDEASILEGLTPPMRLEVVHHILRETIGRIPLFKQTLDISFQLEIFPLFQPMSAVTRETIFWKGELSHGLFFLLKGRAEAISAIESRVLYNVKAGQSFGESVLTGRRRATTIRAITPCEMYTVSRASLHELFNKRPREGRLMHAALLREHIRKEKMRALSLRMLMNKLACDPTQEAIELIAALRLQLYWTRVTESMSLEMMPMQGKGEMDEEKPRPLSEQIMDKILFPKPPSETSTLISPGLQTLRNTPTRPGPTPYSPLRDASRLLGQNQQQSTFPQNPLSLKRVADLQADMKKLLTMVGDMQSQLGQESYPRATNGTAETLI